MMNKIYEWIGTGFGSLREARDAAAALPARPPGRKRPLDG